MAELCDFYCLSFNNEKRKSAMVSRFKHLGINSVNISAGVEFSDPRIAGIATDDTEKRVWSFTYGHFDMIRDFYFDSEKQYGIFCEDDIFIRKDFVEQLPKIIENVTQLNLDILLLGYLIDYNIEDYFAPLSVVQSFSYYRFPDFVWGAQMYLLTKKHAWTLLKKYSPPYAELSIKNPNMTTFNSDWTITKEGNRALIFPMFAVEDGKTQYADPSQQNYHQRCFNYNYIDGAFYE